MAGSRDRAKSVRYSECVNSDIVIGDACDAAVAITAVATAALHVTSAAQLRMSDVEPLAAG